MQRQQQPFHHLFARSSTIQHSSCSTLMFLSTCTWIRDSRQVSLTKPIMTIFFYYICLLGTFSIGLHLELAPGHMNTDWEWIKAVLTCLLMHLLSSWLFSMAKWMKILLICPSNPGTRYQRDLSLCNEPKSTQKHLLATVPEVWHCPVHSAKLHLAVISIKVVLSVQQPSKTLKLKISRKRSIYTD